MTLSIDRLSVRLPEGFEHRADSIVRLMAAELAGLLPPGHARLESVSVPPLTLDPRHPDPVVASAMANALAAEVRRLR